ncbi:HK97 family phage prohead protease [Nocardia wallacei]|uniref:HK97 family phage prohead protease n=1 Tax=Nocardia wallacei TaxID=480035 RepID=UPI0024547EE3|nr:HK97 family phage prohead protease [Nocardia wallacei]
MVAVIALVVAVVALVAASVALVALGWLAVRADRLARIVTADNAADRVCALSGDPVTADSDARTVTGLIVPYGVVGDTSAGAVAVQAGAFTLPPDLSRIKLLNGHDREQPIGYLTATREDSAGLWGTFAIAPGPAGDEAISAARNKIRDGLSYEVSRVRYCPDRSRITAARLDAVALCSVPAYDDARVVAASRTENTMLTVETARAILADPDAPGHERAAAAAFLTAHPDATDADRETAAAAADSDAAPPQPPAPAAPAAVPVSAVRAPLGLSTLTGAAPAQLTAEQAVDRMAAMIRGSADTAQINAALSDVLPADDAGHGILRQQWIGELWNAQNLARPFIDSISRSRLTSAWKVTGWRWVKKPAVGPYTGNKTDVPSNKVSTEPAEATPRRWAGGWDVDRVFVDLGDPSFLNSFLQMAIQDYGQKTEAGVAADMLAAATVPAETATDLISALDIAARSLSGIGANLSFIGISADLWSAYFKMPAIEAPWWLAKQASINLSGVSTTVDGQTLRVFPAATLPAMTLVAGDRRAMTYYEASPSPVRVQAVNLPKGGIDVGVFGYDATIANDARALVKVTITPPTPSK